MTFLLLLLFFVGLANAMVSFLAVAAKYKLGDEMDLDEKFAAGLLGWGCGFNALLLLSSFALLV